MRLQTQYRHTHFNCRYLKWISKIKYDGKRIHLGYFNSSLEAAIAYNAAQVRYFGDDARLIHIESPSALVTS